MRDEQVRRYARHIMLPEIGGLGQTALLVATATLSFQDRVGEPLAALVAGTYLAAGGVGTIVLANATDAQRAVLAAHGPDTKIASEGRGRPVLLLDRPPWWPGAEGDDVAVAFWRGSIAATSWMTDAATR